MPYEAPVDFHSEIAVFAKGIDPEFAAEFKIGETDSKMDRGDKILEVTLRHSAHPDFVFALTFHDPNTDLVDMKDAINEKYKYFSDRNWSLKA
ncbi:MAG: hypothetical protein WCG97_02565 [bacterium]